MSAQSRLLRSGDRCFFLHLFFFGVGAGEAAQARKRCKKFKKKANQLPV